MSDKRPADDDAEGGRGKRKGLAKEETARQKRKPFTGRLVAPAAPKTRKGRVFHLKRRGEH